MQQMKRSVTTVVSLKDIFNRPASRVERTCLQALPLRRNCLANTVATHIPASIFPYPALARPFTVLCAPVGADFVELAVVTAASAYAPLASDVWQ